jgi:hypothetical protein
MGQSTLEGCLQRYRMLSDLYSDKEDKIHHSMRYVVLPCVSIHLSHLLPNTARTPFLACMPSEGSLSPYPRCLATLALDVPNYGDLLGMRLKRLYRVGWLSPRDLCPTTCRSPIPKAIFNRARRHMAGLRRASCRVCTRLPLQARPDAEMPQVHC